MSSINDQVIPWQRFWRPSDTRIHRTEYGGEFLPDPEDRLLGRLNPTVSTIENWAAKSALILCGDPGMGKSTEMQRLEHSLLNRKPPDDQLLSVNFRDIPSDAIFDRKVFNNPLWQNWVQGTGRFFLLIDSLDEGILKVPGFLNYLRAELKSAPIKRLRLILACRSAEWPRSEGDHLLSLWDAGSYERLELCPLRRKDFMLAAENMLGRESEFFVREVFEHNVEALASRPITLFYLLREFKPGSGLPNSHRELYRRITRSLAREIDPSRADTLRSLELQGRAPSHDEVFKAASVMATILILCGRSAVFTGPADDKADEDISLEELAVEGFNGERLSERVFLAAISSALFSSRGARRFGFAHQTLAECLTAEMLQKMEFRQALSLLCATDNGQIHVIPQLSETAAWLAGERDDFLNYLVQRDPVALLRSDISKVSDETKTALVHSLLDGAKKEEVFDVTEYRTFYRSLNHPGLAAQLRPIITDKQLNQVARRMAIDIAEACRIVELSNECLAVVQDTSDLLHIRENCAHALEEILPANLLPVLEALAFGQFPPDGDDSIRGSAIRRLIPEQWSVSKALKALRPPQNRNLFGAYHATLEYHLPKNIQVAEVPKLLCWLALRRDCFDHLSWSRSIADRTLLLALQNLQVPAIRSAAARIWLRKLKHHSALPDSDRFESFKLLRDSDDVRREFVRAIVEHPRCSIDDIRFLGGYQINLLLAQDLRWALDHLNKTRALRDRWSAVISEIFWTDRLTAEWDYFLDTLEQVPELKAALPWVRAWQLDEQVAKDAKSRHLKEREWKERIKRNQPSKTVRELLEDALALSEKEIVQGWCQLASSMELDDGPHGRGRSRNHDLRTCPGWQLLTSAEQDRVPSLAERFLLELGSRQQIPAAMEEAIYQAVWLLLPRIAESEPLAQVIAAKCLPALLRRFNSHNEYQITCVLAAALNRQEVLRHFKKRFEQKAQRDDGDLYGLVDFEKVWAEDFGAILTDILRRSTTQAATLQSGFTFFASVDAAAALQLATEMLSKTTLQTDPKASIIAGLLYSAPSEAWPIFEGACADEDIARNVLMRIATQLDHHGRQILPRLTEKQLGYLYLTMKRLFPFDEPPDSEDSTVTPERAIVWFRNDVLSTLAARSNANAVEELTNLGNAFPKERLWLRWRARDARTGLRMAQWLPPSPEHLLRLIREGSSRFVKDENDLLELVIESLDRLQTRLTRQANPRAEDLWQWDGADGKRHNFSPKEENFLSNYIAESLKQDLEARALFVGRELQLRPSQRTDIHIAATALPSNGGTPLDRLDLVVEVKGSWNPEVPTALESQLVSRYLRPNGYTYGIYIIGFYSCSKYGIDKTGCSSLENLRVTAQGWASSFDGRTRPETVRAFVLDCRYQG